MSNIGYWILAVGISFLLWLVVNGEDSTEQSFDLPVRLENLSEELVNTGQSHNFVNVRVLGNRAALRRLSGDQLVYIVDVSGAQAGVAIFDVDTSQVGLPRGVRVVSRSPARLELRFEPHARKWVKVDADLEGEPAKGFEITKVEVDPPRVRIEGARSAVLRLSEVVTEPIDITDLAEVHEREARLAIGSNHVWVEDDRRVTVRIVVKPTEPPPVVEEQEG